eukprot:scaffold10511_cov19-Prasinocladus_malaysianus.AAC.1
MLTSLFYLSAPGISEGLAFYCQSKGYRDGFLHHRYLPCCIVLFYHLKHCISERVLKLAAGLPVNAMSLCRLCLLHVGDGHNREIMVEM